MPGPSASFSTVTVIGAWRTLKGDPVTGKVRFTATSRVVGITDNLIFPAGTVFEATLSGGAISIDLPAVDDPDNTPADWSYAVEEQFTNATGSTYTIKPRVSGGLNLRDVVIPGDTTQANLVRGVAGGVAGLNPSGRVVDATGAEVLSAVSVATVSGLQSILDALAARLTTLEAGGAADTTPPTTPTSVTASAITSSSFTLSWGASTDAVGVTGYDVQVNGMSRATPSTAMASITGLNPSTAYAVRVRARDAAGNWSALTTAITVTAAAPAAAALSIFGGTAHPGPLTRQAESPVRVATAFYTVGPTVGAWRNVGGRLYVPASTSVPSSCEMSVWEGSNPDLSGTPSRTATLTGITQGQWNEVRWATPLPTTATTPVWIGYRFADGTYLYTTSQSADEIKSSATDFLVEAAADELVGRSRYRYDSGESGPSSAHFGIDCLFDTGA